MSDATTSTKKRRNKKSESATVTELGVAASGESNTGGKSSVEARGDAGDKASANSTLQTARKLLSKMVQRIRKILRLDS